MSFAHAQENSRKIICPTCLEASHYTQGCHASTLADHVISTGHNIKWDNFDIFATGKSDLQCKIKGTLLISELKPSLNENVGSERHVVVPEYRNTEHRNITEHSGTPEKPGTPPKNRSAMRTCVAYESTCL